MRTLARWSLRVSLAALLAGGLLVAHTLCFRPLRIDWFFERVFAEFALKDPELLSSMRMLPAWADWYSADLTDASLDHERQLRAKFARDLVTLRAYNRASLDDRRQLSYDILEYFLATQVEGQRFQHHNHPLNQFSGAQNELPTFLATQHSVKSVREAENYLARLHASPRKLRDVLEGVKLRERKGILPPTFVVEKVLAEMRSFLAVPATQNVLYTSLDERLGKLPSARLDPATRQALLARARAVIELHVYPVYQELISYYDDLLPRTRGNHGVWSLPEGDAFYAWSVRQHTTTDLTPAQVHALGLREVARLETQMDALLRAEGLTEGPVGARVTQLSTRPNQLYPDTDAGRAQILADYQAHIDEIDRGVGACFDVRPTAKVKVERVPVFREKTAPGAYYEPPAFDGSRPGIFYANLRSIADIHKLGMRTLAYHEAIPGHHFQMTLQQEMKGVPTFRKILPFTAFSEGWALYAEQLAWELGFQDHPLDNLGRLQAEMFRAVRLVVDTGLHDQRWTRERAIDYMTDKTGLPSSSVVAEIERYLVNPGQALAYKVGMMKLLELRERAKSALGPGFDLKRFHNLVLTGGNVPLTLLEQRVDRWISSEKARP